MFCTKRRARLAAVGVILPLQWRSGYVLGPIAHSREVPPCIAAS